MILYPTDIIATITRRFVSDPKPSLPTANFLKLPNILWCNTILSNQHFNKSSFIEPLTCVISSRI